MKTRLDLAHEYAMLHMMHPQYKDVDDLEMVKWAHDYADAMLAEDAKREDKLRESKRKEMREMMNAKNTFLEKEGQHFDDVEWQPDWSQAPKGVKSWHMDADGRCYWVYDGYGTLFEASGKFLIEGWAKRIDSPSFGYTGNWRDSLRKRPK